jgi:hypothetical protein
MATIRKQRDLPVTIYRVLLYLSRMRVEEPDAKRLVRIERATGIDRKELKNLLNQLTEAELITETDSGKLGRGGHPVVHWDITEAGRMWRSDIGRFIQFGERLGYYPSAFFYLPSDAY